MSSAEIRSTIVGALYLVNATKDVKPSLLEAFEEGLEDIRFKDLLLGSLARMEILVALELEHGAVIAPREFADFKSLNDVVARVERAGDEIVEPQATEVPTSTGENPTTGDDEPKPPVVRLFQRAYRRCHAVAQLNKTLKILEHRLTPAEFATLRSWHEDHKLIPAQAGVQFESTLRDWLDHLERMIATSNKPVPEPFTYNRVAPAAIHFVGPGERADKTLLICFATVGGRQLWVPNPVLLQFTDATRYDLLVLSDPWRTGFRTGVPLMGGSVGDVVEWIAALECVGEYGEIRTLGCSAGAYPAMLTGRRLDAELAIGISGRFPEDQRRHLGQVLKIYFNSWIASRRNTSARALMIYGKRSRDRAYARRLAFLTGANRLHVEMPGIKVRHNMMRLLIEHGELNYFLEQTLFAPVESDLLAASGTFAKMSIPVDGSAAAPELIVDV